MRRTPRSGEIAAFVELFLFQTGPVSVDPATADGASDDEDGVGVAVVGPVGPRFAVAARRRNDGKSPEPAPTRTSAMAPDLRKQLRVRGISTHLLVGDRRDRLVCGLPAEQQARELGDDASRSVEKGPLCRGVGFRWLTAGSPSARGPRRGVPMERQRPPGGFLE